MALRQPSQLLFRAPSRIGMAAPPPINRVFVLVRYVYLAPQSRLQPATRAGGALGR
jgi:hypothetical protein